MDNPFIKKKKLEDRQPQTEVKVDQDKWNAFRQGFNEKTLEDDNKAYEEEQKKKQQESKFQSLKRFLKGE